MRVRLTANNILVIVNPPSFLIMDDGKSPHFFFLDLTPDDIAAIHEETKPQTAIKEKSCE